MKRPLMVMLLGVAMALSASAQNFEAKTLEANDSGLTDPKELEAWMDQFLAEYLRHPYASLGFVLVKDGKIFFQKGYGYADVD